MRKIIDTHAWDFAEPATVELPRARDGFGTNDLRKLAARLDPELASKIAKLEWHPGEVPIHLIAIGCTEAFGPNRNGDGFKEAACRQYHPTFVKKARFYRHHKSGDPSISYGVVKLSHYNERMRRIELVCGLNGDEKTAKANGGLVADKEMEKIAAGLDIPVSMGTYVPYDVCSACNNQAPTRREYCGDECPGGGLRTKIGALLSDGTVLHADNPICDFNDISHVGRQADRIAFVTGLLQKHASLGGVGDVISGAELAEYIYGQLGTRHPLMEKLSAISLAGHDRLKLAFVRRKDINVPGGAVKEAEIGAVTAALADAGIVLPADQFVRLLGCQDPRLADQVKFAVARTFDELTDSSDNPYRHRDQVPTRWAKWAAELAPDYSVHPTFVRSRVSKISLELDSVPPSPQKFASADGPLVSELADQYGLYVTASLERIQRSGRDFPLTALGVCIQNQAC